MMGVYYRAVCHTCRKVYFPFLRKLSEIRLSESTAADLGRWLCRHANNNFTGIHHEVELLGDYEVAQVDDCADYREEVLDAEDGKVQERPAAMKGEAKCS